MRSCGSDDIGYYGRVVQALMMFVGLKDGPGNGNLPLHNPRFLPSNEALGAVACAQAVAFTAATEITELASAPTIRHKKQTFRPWSATVELE